MPPEKRKRRPRDANQLAKAIVDIATGETEDRESTLGKTHPQVFAGPLLLSFLHAYRRSSSLRWIVIALRSTSKMTAVDHPNNSTPFIAVIGPSNCQCSRGSTSP